MKFLESKLYTVKVIVGGLRKLFHLAKVKPLKDSATNSETNSETNSKTFRRKSIFCRSLELDIALSLNICVNFVDRKGLESFWAKAYS